ncbi:hypothetical protein ABER99_18100 [Paenibacillus glucanolyticus]|nr:hypothetical protein [Paenibacillus glucanolyticus]
MRLDKAGPMAPILHFIILGLGRLDIPQYGKRVVISASNKLSSL